MFLEREKVLTFMNMVNDSSLEISTEMIKHFECETWSIIDIFNNCAETIKIPNILKMT